MQIRMSLSVVRTVMLIPAVTALTAAASAQVFAPPPPDEPAIYISSEFVADDGPVKVVKDLAIEVAGVSITGASGRMRGSSQITIENATITISPSVATHVRSRLTYRRDQLRELPPGK
jgi:hypothetical protein